MIAWAVIMPKASQPMGGVAPSGCLQLTRVLLAGGAPRVALWWSKLWTTAPLL
jgi:hypothetical protein